MRRLNDQSGFGLIMLLGIISALAILAVMLVAMLDNRQHAVATERNTKTSLYYAEAGLNSAVGAVENDTSWLKTPFTNTAEMNQNYSTLGSGPTVTYQVYDNLTPINTAVNWDSNGDGEVWVQTTTTYLGRTTTVRQLVCSSSTTSVLPLSAAWTDTNMTLSGTSNIYAVNPDGSVYTSGPPYETTVMVGGNFSDNSSTNLADPGQTAQSVGLQVNGTVPKTPSLSYTTGDVGLLSDYFNGAEQMGLVAQAQLAITNQSTLFDSAGTSVTKSAAPYTTWTATTSTTWAAGTGVDYVVPSSCNSGNLTLSAASGKASTFTFNKLWVAGNLTISGNVQLNTTGLYVGGTLTINGSSAHTGGNTDCLGPLYVAGTVIWEGASNSTVPLNVTTATTWGGTPGPMFAKILCVDGNSASGDNTAYDSTNKPGPTNLELGNVWIDGDPATGDIAVNFSAPSTGTASTVFCTVLATTERTYSNGLITFGSLAQPMVYFMVCDNDGLYSNEMEWNNTGTYYGVMILFEAEAKITAGNITGAVMEGCPYVSGSDTGTDLTLSNNATICYNPTIINNINIASLRTTTVAPVPGSWQELSGE